MNKRTPEYAFRAMQIKEKMSGALAALFSCLISPAELFYFELEKISELC